MDESERFNILLKKAQFSKILVFYSTVENEILWFYTILYENIPQFVLFHNFTIALLQFS
jgi:hypothetical protein